MTDWTKARNWLIYGASFGFAGGLVKSGQMMGGPGGIAGYIGGVLYFTIVGVIVSLLLWLVIRAWHKATGRKRPGPTYHMPKER